VGSLGGGLCRLKDGQPAFFKKEHGLSSDFVYSIYEDLEGSLWIGTNGGGLNRLRDGKFLTYTTKEGLSENIVSSIFEDLEGNIWIGAQGGGLNRLKNNRFTIYTTKDGLAIMKDLFGSARLGAGSIGIKMANLLRSRPKTAWRITISCRYLRIAAGLCGSGLIRD
jgi:ligand-binding sensor domain-containing protein